MAATMEVLVSCKQLKEKLFHHGKNDECSRQNFKKSIAVCLSHLQVRKRKLTLQNAYSDKMHNLKVSDCVDMLNLVIIFLCQIAPLRIQQHLKQVVVKLSLACEGSAVFSGDQSKCKDVEKTAILWLRYPHHVK